ncbi:VanZ family protein [Alkalilacustris brevis]|uniref:VanZ family protein n=1 Tax=Alkalilacustris brevis TaxID=2026338 RepID=UPI00138FEEC7|nr:VanZ family protein [Alkalilacustris brevis]
MRYVHLHRFALLLTGVMTMLVLAGTLTPGEAMPRTPRGADKLFHFLGFFAVVFPAVLVRPRNGRWLLPGAILLGGAIELIQPHVGRHAEWGDFIANTLGAFAGAVLAWLGHVWLVLPWRRRRARQRVR